MGGPDVRSWPADAPFPGPYLVQDRVAHDGWDRKVYVASRACRGLLKPWPRRESAAQRPFAPEPMLGDLALADTIIYVWAMMAALLEAALWRSNDVANAILGIAFGSMSTSFKELEPRYNHLPPRNPRLSQPPRRDPIIRRFQACPIPSQRL